MSQEGIFCSQYSACVYVRVCVLQTAAVGPSLSEQRPAGVWAAGQTEPADAGETDTDWGGAQPTHRGTHTHTYTEWSVWLTAPVTKLVVGGVFSLQVHILVDSLLK